MVSQITNHDTHFIRRKMPYARALQYRTIYCDLHDVAYVTPKAKSRAVIME